MSGPGRVLHLVRGEAKAEEPGAVSDADTVVHLDGADAPDAERLLDLIMEHDSVVTW